MLLHAGASEAAEIAARSDLSDVEKGAESDRAADALCDLAEDLARRIPYLAVFVSMLRPRFDLAASSASSNAVPSASSSSGGMSLPNSVRRVMNVQISMRLCQNEKDGGNIR